jgi:branched-chain amino acid transport system substrate-binding protein
VTDERYARSDTSVTGQILRLMSTNPDAIVVGGSGTGAALPHVTLIERGYKKGIYHNHGTVNAEFIKDRQAAAEARSRRPAPGGARGSWPTTSTKKVSLDFITALRDGVRAGTRNAFAGYAYDGVLLLDAAAPVALKKAKPGTPEFRAALRDVAGNVKNVVGTHGVYNMTPANHNGLDERARVVVQVVNGAVAPDEVTCPA